MENIIIREISLPCNVRAFTLPDEQGDYNVYINSSLSDEQRKMSFIHELRHIKRNDFYKRDLSAEEIEAQY
ncbi:MAG: hypothetical protein J1E34_10015 [Oscillospiraceae bacterium]|nr:hypothetical protein [Oscillospiraceae bacterium]